VNCHQNLLSSPTLQKEVSLTTDASELAIGGVLSQDGHPVIYIARKLTSAESNYSNIEREALAIVYSVKRLRQFLLGRTFKLNTDHRPLQYIFAPNTELPKTVSARITRWAISLMAFDYDITYHDESTIPHADAFSRLRFEQDDDRDNFGPYG
jgi:hypothetical protein